MGNCIAYLPEDSRRRRPKRASHKAVSPLNHVPEEELPQTVCSNWKTTEGTNSTCSKPKRSVRFAGEVDGDHRETGSALRVKVVMSKKEAAQLLSTLLADINERSLKSIDAANMLQGGSKFKALKPGPFKRDLTGKERWTPSLHSIPENCRR